MLAKTVAQITDENCAKDCNTKDAVTAFTSGNSCTTASQK